jgi:hypothetical protein
MDRVNPRDVIEYCHILDGIHNKHKVAMSSTTASGGNACSFVAELALEDLERRIGWKTNDLDEFLLGESEVVAHLGTVLTLKGVAGETR